MQQLQLTIVMFDQRGTTLDPVAIIAIKGAIDFAYLGAVDMTAHHPLVASSPGLTSHSHLKIRDVIQGLLDLVLEES
jgi:hypothetical protein